MEYLTDIAQTFDLEKAISLKDNLVSPIAKSLHERIKNYSLNQMRGEYDDEDDYEAYPDFDYTEDL